MMDAVIVLILPIFIVIFEWMGKFRVLLNQFYEHQTAADHVGDLLVVRLASFNQLLDPWVYILCKKVKHSDQSNSNRYSAFPLFSSLCKRMFVVSSV